MDKTHGRALSAERRSRDAQPVRKPTWTVQRRVGVARIYHEAVTRQLRASKPSLSRRRLETMWFILRAKESALVADNLSITYEVRELGREAELLRQFALLDLVSQAPPAPLPVIFCPPVKKKRGGA